MNREDGSGMGHGMSATEAEALKCRRVDGLRTDLVKSDVWLCFFSLVHDLLPHPRPTAPDFGREVL